MPADHDVDRILDAYCHGLYAMDPRTTFPFWDYDIAPLYSREWIAKIGRAAALAGDSLPDGGWTAWFAGPSVPRKELIYALVDVKVGGLGPDEWMPIVDYWIDLLRDWCGEDWLSDKSNRASTDDVGAILEASHWTAAGRDGGRAVGAATVALHALSYGLYSDVFAHQSGEVRGPYDIEPGQPQGRSTLVLRTWRDLRPQRLWPTFPGPGFSEIAIAAVYRDCRPRIDIYNHVSWDGIPALSTERYCVFVDGAPVEMSAADLSGLAEDVARLAAEQFDRYARLAEDEKRRIWVRQRNHQFRRFFEAVGLSWEAPEMEAAVTRGPLHRRPLWDTTLDRGRLFRVWRACLDPRSPIGYPDWDAIFAREFPDAPGR